jgi:hypothetical protein
MHFAYIFERNSTRLKEKHDSGWSLMRQDCNATVTSGLNTVLKSGATKCPVFYKFFFHGGVTKNWFICPEVGGKILISSVVIPEGQ